MLFFKKKPEATITLFNTKGREKQVFEPLTAGRVKMYSCGPTVYDYVHIGNLRAFLLSDIIRRTFEYAGYQVTQVMNITDFGHLVGDGDEGEDKMSLALKREGKPITMENMLALASMYAAAFKEDIAAFNIRTPQYLPRASEHVRGMVAYIETLLHKGYAYQISDGIYFDTAKWPEYGALGGSASEKHSRIGVSGEKHDPRDFALWKFSRDMGWEAPWGRGFPGWHIECTAMSTRYLGKTFDIHTGGIDHIPVHHNNEIAQAEAANAKPYARYWLHNEFITIDNARERLAHYIDKRARGRQHHHLATAQRARHLRARIPLLAPHGPLPAVDELYLGGSGGGADGLASRTQDLCRFTRQRPGGCRV